MKVRLGMRVMVEEKRSKHGNSYDAFVPALIG